MSANIAILGAGRMGSAIALRLLAQQYGVSVWNRTRSRAAPLAEHGARIAGSVVEAVRGADLTIVILNDYTTADGLLRAPEVAAALRAKPLVQLTSGSPRQARTTAEWARGVGIAYLDGAIMATPDRIGQPDCMILYAGEPRAYDAHLPLWNAIAGHNVYLGSDVGHAAALDSALLMQYWGPLFGAVYAAAIVRAEQVPFDTYRTLLPALLPVLSESVLELVDRMQRADFATTPATLETHHGGLQHVLAICGERGIDRAIPDAFVAALSRALEQGRGHHDFAALIEVLARA